MAWTSEKGRKALNDLWIHGQQYRGLLYGGLIHTVGLVLFRLAMPWPLRGFIELVVPGESGRGALVLKNLPEWGDQLVWLSVIYIIIAVVLGIFEYYQRVLLRKYSAYTVHSMREMCVNSVLHDSNSEGGKKSADIISRLVGDSARIKAEMAGILVHFSQNILLFIGICAVFFFISVEMAFFFLIAGLCAIVIGYLTAIPIAANVMKQRKKEGQFAVMIQDAIEGGFRLSDIDDLNLSNRDLGVRTARLMAVSSLFLHGVLATVTVAALWVIVSDVKAGVLETGDLFLFIAYVLMVHRRMVQVGRQLARSGKALANVNRLMDLTVAGKIISGSGEIKPLTSHVDIKAASINAKSGDKKDKRIRNIDLRINSGEKIIVTGNDGSGKSTLLQMIACKIPPDRGEILWDGENIWDQDSFRPSIAYVSDIPVFQYARVWKLLGLDGPDSINPKWQELLEQLGAGKLISRMSNGINDKVSSSLITVNEARALHLFNELTGVKDVLIIDDTVTGLKKKAAEARIRGILENAGTKTIIASMIKPIFANEFDRIIVLKNGKIRFDGAPDKWAAEKITGE